MTLSQNVHTLVELDEHVLDLVRLLSFPIGFHKRLLAMFGRAYSYLTWCRGSGSSAATDRVGWRAAAMLDQNAHPHFRLARSGYAVSAHSGQIPWVNSASL